MTTSQGGPVAHTVEPLSDVRRRRDEAAVAVGEARALYAARLAEDSPDGGREFDPVEIILDRLHTAEMVLAQADEQLRKAGG